VESKERVLKQTTRRKDSVIESFSLGSCGVRYFSDGWTHFSSRRNVSDSYSVASQVTSPTGTHNSQNGKEQGIIITGVTNRYRRHNIDRLRCSFQNMRTKHKNINSFPSWASFQLSVQLCLQNFELQNSTYVQRNNSFLQINIIISVAADCSFLFPLLTSSVS
jgi:hypothetical protein